MYYDFGDDHIHPINRSCPVCKLKTLQRDQETDYVNCISCDYFEDTLVYSEGMKNEN